MAAYSTLGARDILGRLRYFCATRTLTGQELFQLLFVLASKVEDIRQCRRIAVARGDKSKYTDKQERKADHIAEGYEKRGVSDKEAERRAWATVNKDDGGGKEPGGSGRGKSTGHPAAHKGGRVGGRAAAARPAASRSASAKKAAATRKRNAEHRAH
jgi:plasmid stabilization system protein ParE